ncbi:MULTISPECIES: putative DNA-binding domain-containing protein [Cysteiniphilum]|uniref:HvfC/BufC family peptide modification chaperone n=1 Tax=Cysteiniphilum TaxID=2056696 RepID=UPI00178065FC|nr:MULTISPECIES: putative DNA-binding domain-containing protein [Cysteiniphilum]
MLSNTHQNCKIAPSLLVIATNRLCQNIRCKQHDLTYENKPIYRNFILGNIQSVIEGTFPLFNKMTCPKLLTLLIEDFLMHHPANEPQFHHIATEFLRFAQSSKAVPALLLAVLEYEWLLFSTEINPKRLDSKAQETYFDAINANVKIVLNPTAQYICLPFELADCNNYCPIGQGQYIYIVFRNINGCVITKNLSNIEIQFLKNIKSTGNNTYQKSYQHRNSEMTKEIMKSFIKINLIHIEYEE